MGPQTSSTQAIPKCLYKGDYNQLIGIIAISKMTPHMQLPAINISLLSVKMTPH